MPHLFTVTHPERPAPQGQLFKREAVRAIAFDGEDLLMLYTRRYDDYSFPGGGLVQGETIEACLLRELSEETGAAAVNSQRYLGYVDEIRPYRRNSPDTLMMRSHFFHCVVSRALGVASPEHYEVDNGMSPLWINPHTALEHNEALLRTRPDNIGLSIYRETQMLRYVMANSTSISDVGVRLEHTLT